MAKKASPKKSPQVSSARPVQPQAAATRAAADNNAATADKSVTREKKKDCNDVADRFYNGTRTVKEAEITIEAVNGDKDCDCTVNVVHFWKDEKGDPHTEILIPVLPETMPSGPHKVEVFPKGTLSIRCGRKGSGECAVKYTFRWT